MPDKVLIKTLPVTSLADGSRARDGSYLHGSIVINGVDFGLECRRCDQDRVAGVAIPGYEGRYDVIITAHRN